MPQIGAQHYLYLAYTAGAPTLPKKVTHLISSVDGTPVGGTTGQVTSETLRTAADLQLYDNIRDVEVGGDNNTVDTTTRESARQGFATEAIATTTQTMTVTAVYETRSTTDGTIVDENYYALFYAFSKRLSIFAVDLDGPITQQGAAGIGGNWTIGWTRPKPVQGLVEVNWTFALTDKAQAIYLDDQTGLTFVAEVAAPGQ